MDEAKQLLRILSGPALMLAAVLLLRVFPLASEFQTLTISLLVVYSVFISGPLPGGLAASIGALSFASSIGYIGAPHKSIEFLSFSASLPITLTLCIVIKRSMEQRRQELQEFLDQMHTLVAKLDTNGNILLVGKTTLLASGVPKERLLGSNFIDGPWWKYDPKVHQRIKKAFYRAATLGEAVSYDEKLLLNRDGTLQPTLINVGLVPVLNGKGRVKYVVAEGRDITSREHMEVELRHQVAERTSAIREVHERFRLLLDNAPVAIFAIDKDGTLQFREGIGSFRAGVRPGQGIGISYFEQFKDVPRHLQNVRKALAGTPVSDHLQVRKGYYHIYYAPILVAGKPSGMIGIATDITELHDAEVGLQESLERFKAVNRASKDIIWDWDMASQTATFSNNIEETFGYKPAVYGVDWWMKNVHPDDRAHLESTLKQAFDNKKEIWSCDYRFRKTDGTYAYVYDRAVVNYDDSGTPTRMIGAMSDTTDRHEAEERIKSLDILKNRFISIVSHQFRTPMSALRWNLELLLKEDAGKLKPGQKELVQISLAMNTQIIRKIRDLLRAIEIEEGQLRLEKEPISLDSLVTPVMGEFKKRCKVKRLSCSYSRPQKALRPVLGSKDALHDVFEKLMENALDYTPEKGRVSIALAMKGRYVRFTIQDTGIGIPKNEQKHLYDRFFRASNAAKMKTDASGLGLYIAKNHVEALGGKISFTSKEGKGTTFVVDLPVAAM